MKPSNWDYFYENIYAALTNKSESAVKLEEVRMVMVVMEAAIEFDKTGKMVEV